MLIRRAAGLLQSYSLWTGRSGDCTHLLQRLGLDESQVLNEDFDLSSPHPRLLKVDIVRVHSFSPLLIVWPAGC